MITDRYKVLSVIGIGGWSTVYRAEDTKLSRQVAVKVLHSHLCIDPDKFQRFEREAKAASSLIHANIGVIYDTGLLAAQRPFIVMEMVEGKTFAEVILENRPLPLLIPIFMQVCDGLAAIHKVGLVHRDLKPSNIIVLPNGAAKVLDFGSVKWISQDDLTRTDETVGTPSYMSPEQCLGTEIDWRSDLYSLGCIMYEAVGGVKAFSGENTLVTMQKQIQSMPPYLSRVRPELKIPQALEHLIFRALAKAPKDRFDSAADLHKALENYDKKPTLGQQALHKQRLLNNMAPRLRVLSLSAGLGLLLLAFALIPPMFAPRRTLNFPAGREAGVLYVMTNVATPNEARTKFVNAEGAVDVPAEAKISLQQVPKKEAATLSCLSSLKPDDLYSLDLYGSVVTVESVREINRMTGLKLLSFSRADLSDQALSTLRVAGLRGLDLADTKISDKCLPDVVQNMRHLSWLALTGNSKVTDLGAVSLARLEAVTALRLSDMPGLTDKTAQALSVLPNLGMIELGSDKISDSSLAALAGAKSLKSLDINNTSVTDDGIKSLLQFKQLQKLNLSGTNITDRSVETLSNLTSLKVLNVSGTKITGSALARLKAKLSQCLFTN